jgi:hypothetical protein
MAIDVCADCVYNVDGYCHALPPRDQESQLDKERPHDAEYYKYPQIIPDAPGCTYFKKV